MNPFTERAIAVMKQIPPGKVMTYGQVAHQAGSPRGARQVVRILHSMSSSQNLPWQRVINAKGEIGFNDTEAYSEQRAMLKEEGIIFEKNGKINLEKYRHYPLEEPF